MTCRRHRPRAPLLGLALIGLFACDTAPPASTPEELARFEMAGPYRPKVDRVAIFDAKNFAGPHRVIPGDVLQFEMPAVMRALAPNSDDPQFRPMPHVCRVTTDNRITLPMVGELEVAKKTLEEVERAAVAAYHPKYTVKRPSIVATLREPSTVNVFVSGAVEDPGMYALASQERTLIGALMKAGGILEDGAGLVKIYKGEKQGIAEPIALPVEGYNIPFDNQSLEGGETIEVLPRDPEVFSVIGLTQKPGTFEYPLGARYTLLQAIGFAGGLDVDSMPSVIQVFRQDASGEVVSAVFDLSGDGYAKAAFVPIKRGDIIAIADTLETRWHRFLSAIFSRGIYLGANYQLNKFND